jgi:O-antigen/teichoic acid export membrane protein
MYKKLLAHSILYTITPQIPRVASFFLLPVFTTYLTDRDFGIYGVISSYVFAVSFLRDLGFGILYTNSFFKYPKRWPMIWRLLHGHLILWSLVFFLILVVVLYFGVPRSEMSNFPLICLLVILPAVVFDNTNAIASLYYRLSQKPLYLSITSVVAGILSVLSMYYVVVVLKWGYLGWFVSLFVSSFVMFLFYFVPVYVKLGITPIIRYRRRFIRPHLKVALPMIPHNYSSYLLNSSDRMMMSWLRVDLGSIGRYNIAYQFGNYTEVVGEAFGMAVSPVFAKYFTSKDDDAERKARDFTYLLMGLFISGGFLLSLWMKEIFGIMIRNKGLVSAYDLAIIIVMGYVYRPMYWNAGQRLSFFEKTDKLWRMSFIAGVLNVVLNAIFIPFFGIYAAAVNTFISLVYLGFSGYYMRDFKAISALKYHPVRWIVFIIFVTLSVYLLRDVSPWIKGGITLAVLALALSFIHRSRERLTGLAIQDA